MDWIEEKIEQMQVSLQEKSLVKSLICYFCIGMTGVGTLYWITRNVCLAWVEVIARRYQQSIVFHTTGFVEFQGIRNKEKFLLTLVNLLNQYGLYIYTVLCICVVGKIFLERKIKPAVKAMTQELKYINLGDYGHEIAWHSRDEMGEICAELEQMRKNLLKSKREQWKLQEEQRKINAAFAHDIRTPLTVIKGYTEFLQKYVPKGRVSEELLLQKLAAMQEQEERLLHFSTTMTTIQNIEKWEISGNWYKISDIMGLLDAVVQGIRQNTDKEICVHTQITEQKLLLDKNLLLEVFENLLGNAVRFAKAQIWVEAALHNNEFTLFVRDDGPGFSDRALRRAMEAYYSEEENSKEHFGIGLSICRMLCENHGGRLTLLNSVEQGAVSAASIIVGTEQGQP